MYVEFDVVIEQNNYNTVLSGWQNTPNTMKPSGPDEHSGADSGAAQNIQCEEVGVPQESKRQCE